MPVMLKPSVTAECVEKILIHEEVHCTTVKNGAAIIRGERDDIDPPIVFHVDEIFDVTMQQDIYWALGLSGEEFEALRRELCDPHPDDLN